MPAEDVTAHGLVVLLGKFDDAIATSEVIGVGVLANPTAFQGVFGDEEVEFCG